jgi:hypothetical protein
MATKTKSRKTARNSIELPTLDPETYPAGCEGQVLARTVWLVRDNGQADVMHTARSAAEARAYADGFNDRDFTPAKGEEAVADISSVMQLLNRLKGGNSHE